MRAYIPLDEAVEFESAAHAAGVLDRPMPDEPADMPPPIGQPLTAARKMEIEWFNAAAEAALLEPTNPLIDGLLDEGAMSVLYGDSNSGKTFAALDMAFHVATAQPWNGRRVKHGFIVYVAAEGGRLIKRRLAALRKRYLDDCGEDAPAPLFALVRYPIDLRSNDANLNELVALIKQAERGAGCSCAWVVVDTLSRAMAGGDENSPGDMGRIVMAADSIRDGTNAHFSYIHHTGKDTARGARGHSLLRAATDTEIEVAQNSVTVTKQRDMESGFSIGFRLVDLQIGTGLDGEPIKSAIVEWEPEGGKSGNAEIAKSVPPVMRLLMEVVDETISETGQPIRPFLDGTVVQAAPDDAIRARYYARIAEQPKGQDTPDKLADRQRKNFNNAIANAIKRKAIAAAQYNGGRWLWRL